MESEGTRPIAAPVMIVVLGVMALSVAVAVARNVTETAGGPAAISSAPLPVGTILPAKLEKTLSLESERAGQEIEAKIMQDVPLPGRQKIRSGSRVYGKVLSTEKSGSGTGIQLTIQFNKIEFDKQTTTILTSLRAMASYEAVRAAQMSFGGADNGTPSGWANTVQIGGDIRFGDGGEVRNRQKVKVGKGVQGGVLVSIRANPAAGCDGPEKGEDTPEALWVFSADACGVYGLSGVQIVHQGMTKPTGTVKLQFDKPDAKLEASTAILLRVVAP